jgi:hypothetical protein
MSIYRLKTNMAAAGSPASAWRQWSFSKANNNINQIKFVFHYEFLEILNQANRQCKK